MIIESPRYTERFGAVRINDVQRILALDSGRHHQKVVNVTRAVQNVNNDAVWKLKGKMAIVIPTKDEKLKLFEGVISGIPLDCLVIVVSNSQRQRTDRFRMEEDTLRQFCYFTHRRALILHQKDPVVGRALRAAGYRSILGRDGLIRDGKAEGMILGMLSAKALGAQYVGFIDSDNYFPGSVQEYVQCFSAGFYIARSPYAMVRILWHYKPKLTGGIFFKKWGRVSQSTNKCINTLISQRTGFETEVIKTGNAGEHAISMKLADTLPYASGYAIEPQQLISIFETFGGLLPMPDVEATRKGVEILQIETRNPHLHEEKGAKHLNGMIGSSLGTIYHSAICDEASQKGVLNELRVRRAIRNRQKPSKPRIYDPLNTANIHRFRKSLGRQLDADRIARA
ncbi:MAG: mannosyl-3-phosphoglycerate synthase [Candidatus Methylomirabilales bacterium]